jgi:hypothetical protein
VGCTGSLAVGNGNRVMDKGQGGCPGHHHCRNSAVVLHHSSCSAPTAPAAPRTHIPSCACPTHPQVFMSGLCARDGRPPWRHAWALHKCPLALFADLSVVTLHPVHPQPLPHWPWLPPSFPALLQPMTFSDTYKVGSLVWDGWHVNSRKQYAGYVLGRWWSCGQMTRFSIIGLAHDLTLFPRQLRVVPAHPYLVFSCAACVSVSRVRSLWCIRCGHARRPLQRAPCQANEGPHIIIRGVVVACVHASLFLCLREHLSDPFVCVRACLLLCVCVWGGGGVCVFLCLCACLFALLCAFLPSEPSSLSS